MCGISYDTLWRIPVRWHRLPLFSYSRNARMRHTVAILKVSGINFEVRETVSTHTYTRSNSFCNVNVYATRDALPSIWWIKFLYADIVSPLIDFNNAASFYWINTFSTHIYSLPQFQIAMRNKKPQFVSIKIKLIPHVNANYDEIKLRCLEFY